jgi:hypothetical protein
MSLKGFKSEGSLFVEGRWLVLHCCKETSSYYRHLVGREFRTEALNRPLWGPHISVVRGEKSTEDLRHLQGKIVEFSYHPEKIDTNGKHWWIPVTSPDLIKVRIGLGLLPSPEYPFHWTIGVKTI